MVAALQHRSGFGQLVSEKGGARLAIRRAIVIETVCQLEYIAKDKPTISSRLCFCVYTVALLLSYE
jgi:hypothetical protein